MPEKVRRMVVRNKKSKIRSLLIASKNELKSYQKNEKFIHLSQACEKTWVAFLLFLELKSGEEVVHTRHNRPLARRLGYENYLDKCMLLHWYHYEGCAGASLDDILYMIDDMHRFIKKEVRVLR